MELDTDSVDPVKGTSCCLCLGNHLSGDLPHGHLPGNGISPNHQQPGEGALLPGKAILSEMRLIRQRCHHQPAHSGQVSVRILLAERGSAQ